jgi:hypothetical protein
MRKVSGKTLPQRMENWIGRLVNSTAVTVDADNLYCGGHWDVVRRIPSSARVPIETWVASAGYGLIPVSAPLTPYAATFDARHPDTVISLGTDAKSWWRLLGEWEGPAVGKPRSFAQLVEANPDSRVVLVLSEAYLAACLQDIEHASTQLSSQDQLSIISGGGRHFDALRQWLIPCDARIQPAVGGAMQSLNVRLASRLLSAGSVSHQAMRQRAQQLLDVQPPIRRPERQQLSDAEVRRFVREQTRKDPNISATRALRALRSAGFACEQGRFTRLFTVAAVGAA